MANGLNGQVGLPVTKDATLGNNTEDETVPTHHQQTTEGIAMAQDMKRTFATCSPAYLVII